MRLWYAPLSFKTPLKSPKLISKVQALSYIKFTMAFEFRFITIKLISSAAVKCISISNLLISMYVYLHGSRMNSQSCLSNGKFVRFIGQKLVTETLWEETNRRLIMLIVVAKMGRALSDEGRLGHLVLYI